LSNDVIDLAFDDYRTSEDPRKLHKRIREHANETKLAQIVRSNNAHEGGQLFSNTFESTNSKAEQSKQISLRRRLQASRPGFWAKYKFWKK